MFTRKNLPWEEKPTIKNNSRKLRQTAVQVKLSHSWYTQAFCVRLRPVLFEKLNSQLMASLLRPHCHPTAPLSPPHTRKVCTWDSRRVPGFQNKLQMFPVTSGTGGRVGGTSCCPSTLSKLAL